MTNSDYSKFVIFFIIRISAAPDSPLLFKGYYNTEV